MNDAAIAGFVLFAWTQVSDDRWDACGWHIVRFGSRYRQAWRTFRKTEVGIFDELYSAKYVCEIDPQSCICLYFKALVKLSEQYLANRLRNRQASAIFALARALYHAARSPDAPDGVHNQIAAQLKKKEYRNG